MSNIIGFLEQAGADAALRHASRETLLELMRQDTFGEPAIDYRETMYCLVLPVKTPKKAPPKKKPAKAPPKKMPAKKAPASKKPTKRR